MENETENDNCFFTYEGRTIEHVEKHQDVPMEFWYRDTETGRSFDVRELPAQYMGNLRQAVLEGDRPAHRAVIVRAIDDDYHFVVGPFRT